MAVYRISGIWKGGNGIIGYAIHTVSSTGVTRAKKVSKADAIIMIEQNTNSATTWVWNYLVAAWKIGENVEVVEGPNGKYLRSNPDNKLTDNLLHLINYDWITPY